MSLKPPREFWPFALKVIVMHTLTYIVFGIIFFHVNDYAGTLGVAGGAEHMRPTSSIWVYLGPVFQPLRGLLYAIALFPFRKALLEMKHGWLALWTLLLVVGILSTSGPNPGSIEGIVYTKTPFLAHFRYSAEVYLQTFFFALLLMRWEKAALVARRSPGAGGILPDMLKSAVAGVGSLIGFAIAAGVISTITGVSFDELSHRPGAQALGWVMVLLNIGAAYSLGRGRVRGSAGHRTLLGVAVGINVLLPVLLGLAMPDAATPVWMNALNLIPAAVLYGLVLALWRPPPSTES